MKEIIMSNCNIKASEIGLGCMRLSTMNKTSVNKLINTALKCGINFLIMLIFMEKENQNKFLVKHLPCLHP